MAAKRPPDGIGRLLRWAVLAFLAYALWHSSFHPPRHSAQPLTPVAGDPHAAANAPGEPDCTDTSLNFKNYPLLSVPFLPSYVPALHLTDTKPGTGPAAVCGQHATLNYEYATRDDRVIFSNMGDAKHPTTVQIGANTMLYGFEVGLTGMKVGGERSMSIPPIYAFAGVKDVHALHDSAAFSLPSDVKEDVITAKATLSALTPAVPASPMKLRLLNAVLGSGDQIQCGDTVTADMTLWKMDGTPLFSTANGTPLTFTPGLDILPYGLEQGVLGMHQNATRILLIPPAYLAPLGGGALQGALAGVNLPEHEMVLAEITLLEPKKPAAPETPSQPVKTNR